MRPNPHISEAIRYFEAGEPLPADLAITLQNEGYDLDALANDHAMGLLTHERGEYPDDEMEEV